MVTEVIEGELLWSIYILVHMKLTKEIIRLTEDNLHEQKNTLRFN